MDTIEFVIAPDTISDAFEEECIEPVLNGVSLVDLVKLAERRPINWVGLTPGDLLGPLQDSVKISRQIGDRLALLRCCCGHRDCGEMTAEIRASRDTVTWEAFRSPGKPPEPHATLGPYEFARSAYEQALEHPQRAGAPTRDQSVLEALARGEPTDAREWLQLAYMEADWPADTSALPRLLGGLRNRCLAGNPIPENVAYLWARDAGWNEGTCGTVVGLLRAANSAERLD